MTTTPVTADINETVDETTVTPVVEPVTTEETTEGLSYDPILNPELDDLRVMIAEKGIKGETRIREAANKRSFPLALQFEQIDQEKAFTLTLGELAASRANEKGQQIHQP